MLEDVAVSSSPAWRTGPFPAVMTGVEQVLYGCRRQTHHRIGAAVVDLDFAIVLDNGAAGEDDTRGLADLLEPL